MLVILVYILIGLVVATICYFCLDEDGVTGMELLFVLSIILWPLVIGLLVLGIAAHFAIKYLEFLKKFRKY